MGSAEAPPGGPARPPILALLLGLDLLFLWPRLAPLTADRHRQPDPELLWRPRDRPPYNRQRFKGPEIVAGETPAALRVFCYGDSNTDGPDRAAGPSCSASGSPRPPGAGESR